MKRYKQYRNYYVVYVVWISRQEVESMQRSKDESSPKMVIVLINEVKGWT